MKTKMISIAAAAVIGLGIAGAAGTASAGVAPAINADAIQGQVANKLTNVTYGYGYGYRPGRRFYCRRLYIRGFKYGNPFARAKWYRHCRYSHVNRFKCRRWYIKGFKYGNPFARHMWYKYCRPYAWYRR